jgi:hypothetical protein
MGLPHNVPSVSFTHIHSFFLVCDIIFIGFSFDEKEKLCAGGGRERMSEKSGKISASSDQC